MTSSYEKYLDSLPAGDRWLLRLIDRIPDSTPGEARGRGRLRTLVYGVGVLISPLIVADGVHLMQRDPLQPDPSVVSEGVYVLVFFVLLAGWVFARSFAELWVPRHQIEPVLGTAPSGARATVFPRSSLWLTSLTVLGLLWVVCQTLEAVLLYRQERAMSMSLSSSILLAVVPLLWLLPVLLGRARAGGLWLTPDGVESHYLGRSWSVRWEDVHWAICGSCVTVVTKPGTEVPVRRVVPRIWYGHKPSRYESPYADSLFLRADAALAQDMIRYAAVFPARRADLGTLSCLTWLVAQDRHPDDRWLERPWLDEVRPPQYERPRTVGGPRRED